MYHLSRVWKPRFKVIGKTGFTVFVRKKHPIHKTECLIIKPIEQRCPEIDEFLKSLPQIFDKFKNNQ